MAIKGWHAPFSDHSEVRYCGHTRSQGTVQRNQPANPLTVHMLYIYTYVMCTFFGGSITKSYWFFQRNSGLQYRTKLFPLTWHFPWLVWSFVAKFTEVSLASSFVWDKAEEGLGMVEPLPRKPGFHNHRRLISWEKVSIKMNKLNKGPEPGLILSIITSLVWIQ